MTELILGILDSQAKLITALVQSQTPAQQQVMWDRYIELSTPLHQLLVKIENLGQPAAPKAA